ncbi:MAG: hypothetical protein PVF18_12775 [Anaerolineales bacterium]|jgi:hypothetical protein
MSLKLRFRFLFQSTKGLILLAVAMISIVTAVWGMLSGPMVEWGVRDIVVSLTGMKMVPAEREGRIIMLYHSIALAVIAIETYMITDLVPMRGHQRVTINATITGGYLLTMIFGLWFGYFGQNFVFHGLFLFGQSLTFFAGALLAAALWPWRNEYRVSDPAYAQTRGGVDLERVAFFTMAIATLGSALFGAVTGSYWGNGHETFLAEDLIREPHKTYLQKSIIGHLHIMLTLIGVAITLIVGRWQDFKGRLHKFAMPSMIIGTIIISLGAWSVVVAEWAHTVIYVGSVPVLLGGLFFVIFSWDKLIRTGLKEKGISKGNAAQKIKALVRDPLKFGVGWQMVYMNFTVTGVGLFMAAKLDEIFRVWPHREERIVLTGHWHILSAIIATIILLYYADLAGLKGKARKWFGWLVIIGSDLAFAAVTTFEMKRLFVSEAEQQPLVNWAMLLNEIGLGILLVVLAALMVWRLIDLFRARGRWRTEFEQSRMNRVPAGELTHPPLGEEGEEVSQ